MAVHRYPHRPMRQWAPDMYSLATAAAACGVSKSVILRAIIAGKISGSKDKHGEWHVEPAPRYAAPPDATALAEAHQRFSLAEQRLLSHLKVLFTEMRLSVHVPWRPRASLSNKNGVSLMEGRLLKSAATSAASRCWGRCAGPLVRGEQLGGTAAAELFSHRAKPSLTVPEHLWPLDLESAGPILSSAIQPAEDLDAPLPSVLRAHEKPPVVTVAADEFRIEWPSQSLGVDTAAPMFSGELAAYLRRRSSLAPELVLEPKPFEVDRTGAIALRVSGITAIAALVAWALVSLPGLARRLGLGILTRPRSAIWE